MSLILSILMYACAFFICWCVLNRKRTDEQVCEILMLCLCIAREEKIKCIKNMVSQVFFLLLNLRKYFKKYGKERKKEDEKCIFSSE